MHLKKLYVDIKSAVFDVRTFVADHVLHVNKEELFELINDPCFSSVDIDIAIPGEKCRITSVGNITQPMCKVGDTASTFPGRLGTMTRVGSGETLVLRGMSVVESLGIAIPGGVMLDMWGPGTEYTDYGHTVNLVIYAGAAEGVNKDNYFEAMNMASLKAAKYLAEAALNTKPDAVEEFTLERPNLEGLPRIAYMFQVFSHAPLTDFTFYGDGCQTALPVLVHPNELLDGALLNRNYYQIHNGEPSHTYQNHPVLLDLYKRHGKDLNFVGMILANNPHTVEDKRRNAMLGVHLTKDYLNPDGVILTKEGGGHPQIDVQMNCELAESLGIKTVIMVSGMLSTVNACEELLLFHSDAANAVVNTSGYVTIDLPKPDRVLGKVAVFDRARKGLCDPAGPITHYNRCMRGAMSQVGNTMYTCENI